MRTVLAVTLLALLAAPTLAQDVPSKGGDKPKTIPFTLLPSRHMLLEVKVNGKGPYKLIFDTGAPINLVTNRLAKETGLTRTKRGGFLGMFGGVDQIDVDELDVGGVVVKKLPAVVMDHPTVKAISDAFESEVGRIDGIVGFPFFGRYATTIDYQKRQLTLKPIDYKPGDYLQDITRNLMAASEKAGEPKVVGAAGLWGLTVERAADDQPGVVVKQVYAGSPAAKAGLKPGDRVLTIDARWTDTVTDTYLAASLVRPGRPAAVVVKRDDQEVTLKVTPVKGY